MTIKSNLAALLGDRNLGRYDYFLKPELKNVWGGAFNGQQFRRKIFLEICRNNALELIIETGAFRGNTTAFMAQQSIPVMSVEYDSRLYGYVWTRFCLNKTVTVQQDDSRIFLKRLSAADGISKSNVFFYLDAHWHEDLPLAEELELVFSNWSQAIVMIDDFQVPGTDYRFDDYGEGKALTLDYMSQVPGSEDYRVYFPAVDDTQETGAKRGCVVVCNDDTVSRTLDGCETLRRY